MPDITAAVSLAAVAGLVGFFIGSVGIGGVLLIPFLAILGGLGIHAAAATALFTFLFTGILGTYLFQRRGTISWRLALPVCAGAVVFGYLGTLAAARIGATALTAVIAALIIVAGIYIFLPQQPAHRERDGRGPGDVPLLAVVGVVSGFGSGLSGAGGPLFSVPIMVVLGFVPLAAVGTSQVLQIVAAISGSLAAVQDGRIDFGIAAWVTGFELAGVAIGARFAHAVSATALRRMAATLCVVVGIFMLVRTL